MKLKSREEWKNEFWEKKEAIFSERSGTAPQQQIVMDGIHCTVLKPLSIYAGETRNRQMKTSPTKRAPKKPPSGPLPLPPTKRNK